MRVKILFIFLASAFLMAFVVFMACEKKTTQPSDEFDVTNDNAHCGLVGGFVRRASGENLEEATVSIAPAPAVRLSPAPNLTSLSSFLNYPNPFTSDTYFAYRLSGAGPHTVTIAIYNLHHELQRTFSEAPALEGANQLLFDGLDDEETPLPQGLYPCHVVVQWPDGADSLWIYLSKGINISDEGGLTSYTTSTLSDGKYVISDVPLNIALQTTTTFAPDQPIEYPANWPYVETSWTLHDRFVVTASKTGYTTVRDTVALGPGAVTRLDFALQ